MLYSANTVRMFGREILDKLSEFIFENFEMLLGTTTLDHNLFL